MLRLDGVSVSIGPVTILRGVNLDVATGEFAGLIGRNGAGKTTLLRTIMGLLRPASGTLDFVGHELAALPTHGRAGLGIGYMPEDRRLVPALSAEENILLPAWAAGANDAQAQLARIYQTIPELTALRARKALQLSGGQQKLVALGRALMAGTQAAAARRAVRRRRAGAGAAPRRGDRGPAPVGPVGHSLGIEHDPCTRPARPRVHHRPRLGECEELNVAERAWLGRVPGMRWERHYGDRIVRCFIERPHNAYDLLAEAAERTPDAEALVCGAERLAYCELESAHAAGPYQVEYGPAKGERRQGRRSNE